ncbi:MAG: NAD(P)-dependent oxidoreductase [Andreesenia angusta]|nr:NAD(P)-dependent oxidoreductase [Andreesenia angusta]
MHKDNKKNIHIKNIEYKSVFLKNDIDVLILGGGRAAEIKMKSFNNQGINPDIYSKNIESEYIKKGINNGNIKRLDRKTKLESIIDNYHIINILTNDEEFNLYIKSLCEKKKKLYLFGEDYSLGNTIIPIQKETDRLAFSMRTIGASPISSRYISEKIENILFEYDDFIDYIISLRKRLIEMNIDESLRYEIMKFINSDDFFYFYNENKADMILKLFYGGDIFEDDSRN